jgi:HNH endonuclease
MWRGRPMSMILDHINGVRDDNRLENLRMVCPNSAATLDTTADAATGSSAQSDIACIARRVLCRATQGSATAPGLRRALGSIHASQ